MNDLNDNLYRVYFDSDNQPHVIKGEVFSRSLGWHPIGQIMGGETIEEAINLALLRAGAQLLQSKQEMQDNWGSETRWNNAVLMAATAIKIFGKLEVLKHIHDSKNESKAKP